MSDNTMMWALLAFAVYGGAMTCACAYLVEEVATLKKKFLSKPLPFLPKTETPPAFSSFAPDSDQGIYPAKPMSDYTVEELVKRASSKQALQHEAWILSKPAYVSAGEACEYDEILRAREELVKRGVQLYGIPVQS